MNFSSMFGGGFGQNGGFQQQQNYQQNNYQQNNYQPQYNILNIGQGINQQELDVIVQVAVQIFQQRMHPFSQNTANAIKNNIGGEWFVHTSTQGNNDFDFSLTQTAGGDTVSFEIENIVFHVFRI